MRTALVILLIFAVRCWAQASSGSLIGDVSDDNSKQLSGISIHGSSNGATELLHDRPCTRQPRRISLLRISVAR